MGNLFRDRARPLVGNHDDALDLSQETFARAFRARARIDPERPFFPWLYHIIRRLCFNHMTGRFTMDAAGEAV